MRINKSIKNRVVSSALAAIMTVWTLPFGTLTAFAEETSVAESSAVTVVSETQASEVTSVPETDAGEETEVPEITSESQTSAESSYTEETIETTTEETTVPTGFTEGDADEPASSGLSLVIGAELLVLSSNVSNLTVSDFSLQLGSGDSAVDITDGMEIGDDQPITFKFGWSINKTNSSVQDEYIVDFDLLGIVFTGATGDIDYRGTSVGTYEVVGDDVIFHITDSDLKGESCISGQFIIHGMTDLNADEIGNKDTTEIGAEGVHTVTVTPDLPGQMWANKQASGKAAVDSSGNFIQKYEVQIQSNGKGAIKLTSLSDVMDSPKMSLITPIDVALSGSVYDNSNNPASLTSISNFSELQNLTMAPGSSIVLTYDVNLGKDVAVEGKANYKNTFNVEAEEVHGDDTFSLSPEATPDVNSSVNLYKSGKLSDDKTRIEWTLSVYSDNFKNTDSSGNVATPNHIANAAMITNIKDKVTVNNVDYIDIPVAADDIVNSGTYNNNDWNPGYEYTYYTDVLPVNAYEGRDFKNDISMLFNGVIDDASSTVYVYPSNLVSKTAGSIDETTGEMTWSVDFTVPTGNVTALKLVDSTGSNHTIDASKVIVSGIGGGYTVSADGSTIDFTTMPAAGTVITVNYTTVADADALISSTTFNNNATYTFTVDGDTVSQYASASIDHDVVGSVDKELTSSFDTNGIMTWTINLVMPGNATDIVLSDSTSGGLAHSIVSGSIAVSGANYTIVGDTVKFDDNVAEGTLVTVTYQTQADADETKKIGSFKNTATLDYKINSVPVSKADSDECPTNVVNIDSLYKEYCWNGDSIGVDTSNRLLWKINLYEDKYPDGLKAGDQIVLEDTFTRTGGDDLSVSFNKIELIENSEYYDVTYNTSSSEFIVTVKKDVPDGKHLVFYYTYKFDDPLAYINSDYIAFRNTVTGEYTPVGTTEKIPAGTSSSDGNKSGSNSGGLLKKIPNYNGGYMTDYSIIVNPDEVDIDAASDFIEVVDTMGGQLRIDKDSISVKDENGNAIADAIYEINGQTVTFRVPDETYCVITYKTAFTFVIGDGTADVDQLSNTVSIVANNTTEDTQVTTWSTNIHESEAFIKAQSGKLEINKYDDTSLGKTFVSGAEFTLVPGVFSKTDDSFIPFDDNDVSHEVKTGVINNPGDTIKQLEFNVIYALSETKPPEGFTRDDSVKYILMRAIGTPEPDPASIYVPSSVSVTYIYFELGDKIEIANTPNKNTFSKFEKDENGNDVFLSGAEITITAMDGQDLSVVDVSDSSAVKTSSAITYTSGTVAVEVTGLPAGKYVMSETKAPTGYALAAPIEFYVGYDGKIRLTADETTAGSVDLSMLNVKAVIKDVVIDKRDMNNISISGATLQIVDENSTVIDEWVSSSATDYTAKLPAGKYTLVEKTAPDGYKKAADIDFEVDALGNVTSSALDANGIIVMKDELITVSLNKEAAGVPHLAGATITVSAASGTTADFTKVTVTGSADDNAVKYTTNSVEYVTGDSSVIISGLSAGDYIMHEEAAPNGYAVATDITFTVDENGNVTGNAVNANGEVVMTDELITVSLNKEAAGVPHLAGATITVSAASGTTADFTKVTVTDSADDNAVKYTTNSVEYVTGDSSVTIRGLSAGDYIMHEEAAPNGYKTAADIKFTVNADGTVTAEGKTVTEISMLDIAADTIAISKVDVFGTELVGAKLRITDTDGNEVDSWTSDGSVHSVRVLPGKYTLEETAAPNGCLIATKIDFEVDDDGNVTAVYTDGTSAVNASGVLVMIDDVTRAKLSKETLDSTGKLVNLPGAVIRITEKLGEGETTAINFHNVKVIGSADDSKVVYATNYVEYTSGNTAAEICKLPAGTYIMTETTAPLGYVKATAIEFTIDENGNVTSTALDADGEVAMIDEVSTVKLSKETVDTTGTAVNLPGAQIKVTAASGTAADFTKVTVTGYQGSALLEQSETCIKFVSGDTAAVITGLPAGTYVMHEEVAPDGYTVATDITFTIDEYGNVTSSALNSDGEVAMLDDIITVSLNKEAAGVPHLAGATITVKAANGTTADFTKVNVTGSADDSTVKYAKDSVKYVTGDSSVTISKLPAGTYIMHEEAAPDGYAVATDITFTVKADGTVVSDTIINGAVVMTDMINTVSFSKQDLDGDELPGASIVIEAVNAPSMANAAVSSNITDATVSADRITFTSTSSPAVVTGLSAGTYKMTETAAPSGYKVTTAIEFVVDEYGMVSVDGTKYPDMKVVMKDAPVEVKISKETVGGANLPNAKLTLTEDGNNVDFRNIDVTNALNVTKTKTSVTFTSGSQAAVISKLPAGNYNIHEDAAPAGYALTTDIKFSVDIDGNVTGATVENGIVVIENKVATGKVVISKRTTKGQSLAGAEIEITGVDKVGNTVNFKDSSIKISGGYSNLSRTDTKLTFKSTVKDMIIDNLPAGTYTMRETSAPSGYIMAAKSIVFEVADDGAVTVNGVLQEPVIIENAPMEYSISLHKHENTIGGPELAGAELCIIDANGNVVDKWTSDGTAHVIKLEAGKYTFRELTAPTGYKLADDVTFTVTDADMEVRMADEKIVSKLVFSKKTAGGEELEGAEIIITSVNAVVDFNNATVTGDFTGLIQKSDSIRFISGKAAEGTVIEGLPAGRYKIEENAAPEGYLVASAIEFEVMADGTVWSNGAAAGTIVMVDTPENQTITPVEPTPNPTPTPDPTPTPTPTPDSGTTQKPDVPNRPTQPTTPDDYHDNGFVGPEGYVPPGKDDDDDAVTEDVSSDAGIGSDESVLNFSGSNSSGYVITLIIIAAAGIIFNLLRKKTDNNYRRF